MSIHYPKSDKVDDMECTVAAVSPLRAEHQRRRDLTEVTGNGEGMLVNLSKRSNVRPMRAEYLSSCMLASVFAVGLSVEHRYHSSASASNVALRWFHSQYAR